MMTISSLLNPEPSGCWVRGRRNDIAFFFCRDGQGYEYNRVVAEIIPTTGKEKGVTVSLDCNKGGPVKTFDFDLDYSLARPPIYKFVFPMKLCNF
jgi:hypothetical protein